MLRPCLTPLTAPLLPCHAATDHSLELPAVDVTYHPAPDEKYAPTVLHRSQAGFLLEGENEVWAAAVWCMWGDVMLRGDDGGL